MRNRDVFHTALHAHRTRAGFTLVELMVTVAVVAILMAVGAPQLRGFLVKQQVAGDVNNLTADVMFARSEALKRNGRVSICALSSATFANSQDAACVTGATNWSNGWMIYIDYSNGAGYSKTSDTVLKIERTVRASSVTSNAPNSPGIISFLSNGIPADGDRGSFFITPSDKSDAQCKRLRVSAQGRLNTSTSCTST